MTEIFRPQIRTKPDPKHQFFVCVFVMKPLEDWIPKWSERNHLERMHVIPVCAGYGVHVLPRARAAQERQ